MLPQTAGGQERPENFRSWVIWPLKCFVHHSPRMAPYLLYWLSYHCWSIASYSRVFLTVTSNDTSFKSIISYDCQLTVNEKGRIASLKMMSYRVLLWTKQLSNCLAKIYEHLLYQKTSQISAPVTWASSSAWELAPGLRTWSKVSPPGGVNAGHSSPAALAIALSSLSARLSATPYFCNGSVDKSASSEFAIQQLSTSLEQSPEKAVWFPSTYCIISPLNWKFSMMIMDYLYNKIFKETNHLRFASMTPEDSNATSRQSPIVNYFLWVRAHFAPCS